MSNARTHSRPSSPFVREYPYWVPATTARIGELRSDQTAARFQSSANFPSPLLLEGVG